MDGRDMLFGNAPRYSAESLTFRVRLMSGTLAILLALLVFLTAQEMFGAGAGLIALALMMFEPNVLAHGAFVATDVGVCCFFVRFDVCVLSLLQGAWVGRLGWRDLRRG